MIFCEIETSKYTLWFFKELTLKYLENIHFNQKKANTEKVLSTKT